MTDIKLFRLKDETAEEISGGAERLESSLQKTIDQSLWHMLRIRWLASQYATGRRHRGKIDTLGIDENNNPVIIEYKRAVNENVINQGLFYLDWLLDHRAEFKLLVQERQEQERLEQTTADAIEWSSPRLLCIAGGFTRYDVHAVNQMNRNIELIRYKRFGDDLLMLELVSAVQADTVFSEDGSATERSSGKRKTISDVLNSLEQPLDDLYQALRTHLLALGDDVQQKTLQNYVAYRRLYNFACVEIRTNKKEIRLFLKIDPDTISLKKGFTQDVRGTGHFGTGDLEVTIRNLDDLERAKPLIQQSYDDM